ncbi:MAG TPA: O-antigen ligase family protein, partial [Vicinamibacterales bacterium]|nr:O-antigen ligase family protein [Vicinamibacterales bacterium]
LIQLVAPKAFVYLQGSISTEWTPASGNFISRLDLTKRFLAAFVQHPVFGYGPGVIQKAAQQGHPDFAGLGGLENQYAVILADGGILAGVCYALFMIATLMSLYRLRRARSLEIRWGAIVVLLLFLFYFLVTLSVMCINILPIYLLMTLFGALMGRAANEREAQVSLHG